MAPLRTVDADSEVRHRPKGSGGAAAAPRTDPFLLDGDSRCRRSPRELLGGRSFAAVLVYFAALTALALYVHGREPAALGLRDAAARPGTFVEERARGHLRALTAFGPRPTGSYANEVLAVEYLARQAHLVRQRADPAHAVEVDVQRVSGSFNLDFQDGFTSAYGRVRNVLVRLAPSAGANHSVMVNCHFDSVPGSPGASDDAVSCAVMLEVLYLLSQTEQPFLHTIIFSFNGAEENILQASHGFITQHKWAPNIKAFINLDSCGSGGRELLFQAGPQNPWLTELYGRGAKYPFACILAQEIFQSGKIVPGDTDYRIFRDYGNIPGLDIAYIRNGYLYHTKFDREEYIPSGSVQRAGENLHGLLRELASSPLVPDPGAQEHGNVVFFDFFGMFLVVYSELLGSILVYCCIAICVGRSLNGYLKPRDVGFRRGSDYLKVLFKGVALMFTSWITALIGLVLIALLLELAGATMSWYSNQYLAFGLFLVPSVLIMMAVHTYFHRHLYKGLDNFWMAEQLCFESHQLVWCSINTILYFFDLKTSMVLVIGVLFPFVFRFIGDRLLYSQPRNHARDFLIINLAAWALPLELGIQAIAVALQILIPLVGRTGPVIQPDLFLAVVFWIATILSHNLTISFVHATKSMKPVLWSLFGVFLLSFFAAAFTPLGHPYSGDPLSPAPQRFLLQHVHRTFHERNGDVRLEDSGMWAVPADFNAAKDVYKYLPELNDKGHKVDDDCGKELMCGMPFYYPALHRLRKSVYLLGPKPQFHLPAKLKLISQSATGVERRKFVFNATGPSHMAIYLSPASNVELVKWSFANNEPYPSLSWDGRPTYFIYYSHGEAAEPWSFWFELKVPMHHPKSSSMLNIAVVAHYLHGDDSMTPELREFLARFPDYTYSMAWPSTYEAFEF